MLTGDRYFDSKDFKDILMSYEKSVMSGHRIFMDVDDLTDIADYYNMIGEKDKADEAIDNALDISPNATLPLVYKAREALAFGDHEKAEEFAERIGDKDDPDCKYLTAELLIARKKTEEAENYLKGYYNEIDYEEHEDFILDVANLYVDYGLNDKAFEWMCKGKRKSAEYKELMARVFFGMEKYEESEKVFNELIDKDPYSKRYWTALASAQFMSEKYNDAITSSEYAIAIDPDDAEAILVKANSLYKMENYEDALTFYKRYCERMPLDEMGELNVATCLINMDMFGEAIKHLEKAKEIAPQNSAYLNSIYRELAFSYSAIKMSDKALEYLEKTEEANGDIADILVLKGHVLLENERYQEAVRMFRMAMDNANKDPRIVLRIIVSFYDNKHLEMAYSMFKSLLTNVYEGFNEGYSYMALCCWDLKLVDEFMKYMNIAVQKNPKEAKKVLGHLFPKNIEPEEYYNYIINNINKKKDI